MCTHNTCAHSPVLSAKMSNFLLLLHCRYGALPMSRWLGGFGLLASARIDVFVRLLSLACDVPPTDASNERPSQTTHIAELMGHHQTSMSYKGLAALLKPMSLPHSRIRNLCLADNRLGDLGAEVQSLSPHTCTFSSISAPELIDT